MQQAKALAEQGMLPAIGGEGTMTFAEFLTLPKPHQMNEIKKVLRTMHGFTRKKDTVVYLPQVGQNVRSYTLQEDQCVSQCGVIKAYTGNSNAAYTVESTQPGCEQTHWLHDGCASGTLGGPGQAHWRGTISKR